MDFRCPCGKVLSMNVAPGTPVQCPSCGQMIVAPGAPPPFAAGRPPLMPGVVPGPVGPRTSGVAVAAFVLGLTSLLFGPVTGIVAIILGIVALSKVKRSQGELSGSGLAVAGLALGVALSVIPILILLPALTRAREAARTTQCAGNLRNINLALFQYTVRSGGQMPPADHNVCYALAPQLGDALDDDRGGEHWRCPSDHFIPGDSREYWCSYVPNASVEETDEVFGTFVGNSALSNSISSVSPDTISFIEMWTPRNVVAGHPGFELKLDHRNPENYDRSMVEPGKELCAIRSYTKARPVKFDADGRLTDPGNYLFLRAFVGKKVKEMYHRGRINVGYIDGHVETKWIPDLIATDRPADNPEWTRDPD